jgi:hypothetical protein
MAVRMSALRTVHALPPERFLVPTYIRVWVNSRAMVRLEGLVKLQKNAITLSEIEPVTFRLIA